MKTKKKIRQAILVTEEEIICCDICGKEITHETDDSVRITHNFGYHAREENGISDGDEIDVDICGHCIVDHIIPLIRKI